MTLPLTSCVGYLQFGKRAALPSTNAVEVAPNPCGIYIPSAQEGAGEFPHLQDHATDDQILEALGKEILRLRGVIDNNGTRERQNYQRYLERCAQ